MEKNIPSLFDMHVHFRDPGQTSKEDIITGMYAAKAGGFSGVACMPNTSPPISTPDVIQYIRDKVNYANKSLNQYSQSRVKGIGVNVYPVATVTKGLKGKELSDFQRLSEEGAIAFSDDGMPVADADLMEKALVEAKKCNALIISHCEDLEIVNGGIMNKGKISEQLDVPGIDRRSEDSITLRDVELAKKTGARLHIAHVSTRGAVEIIRKAKADGVNVTCETAPHYFWFTENDLLTQDADFRMNPPLRTEDDKKAIIEGLVDGTIDCISTDHAPHTPDEKSNFLKAPNGVIGLETALPATLTALYHTNILTLDRIVELMSTNPRKILRLPPIKATVTVDLDLEWTVKPADFLSKGKNCPFKGLKLKGKVVS